MVTLTQQTVSTSVAAKAKAVWVRKLSANSYLVTPKARSKTRRIVTLEIRYGQLMARCECYYTSTPCPANSWGVLCHHCLAAYRRAEINAKKEQRRERAA